MEIDDQRIVGKADADKLRQDAQDDYHREVAGLDVGRIARFLPRTDQASGRAQSDKSKRDIELTQLQLVLQDAAYARLYSQTREALANAQNQLDEALERVDVFIDEANARVTELQDQAAHAPDGRAVFRDEDGNVRYADGSVVKEEIAAGIVWTGDEPSFEVFWAEQQRRDRLNDLRNDVLLGQAKIGDLQNRLEDPEDPPSKDELDDIGNDAAGIVADIDARLNQLASSTAPTVTPSSSAAPPSHVVLPEI